MIKLFDLLSWLSQSMVRLALAVVFPLGFLLESIFNPGGAVNYFACRLIDWIAGPWPETPENLKLGNMLTTATEQMGVGQFVIRELFATASVMLGIVLIIKLYKLIPLKAT